MEADVALLSFKDAYEIKLLGRYHARVEVWKLTWPYLVLKMPMR